MEYLALSIFGSVAVYCGTWIYISIRKEKKNVLQRISELLPEVTTFIEACKTPKQPSTKADSPTENTSSTTSQTDLK